MHTSLLLTLLLLSLVSSIDPTHIVIAPMSDHGPASSPDPLPFSTRAHWMRRANAALSEILSPCPLYAFGTAIVNHTGSASLGELVCIGVNDNGREGNPTLHGEMAAIRNCTKVLTDVEGPYRLSGGKAIAAFRDLSLYTNGEPCPMVFIVPYSSANSIEREKRRQEEIANSNIDSALPLYGGPGSKSVSMEPASTFWSATIHISASAVFEKAHALPGGNPRLIPHVLNNETDPLFAWQNDPKAGCPKGCERAGAAGGCEVAS